jgi:hypothetical protein
MRTALILIVLAAIACCVGFVGNTFDHRAIEWARVFAASLGIALLLPGLALLLLPGRHRAGIAWVTVAGYVAGTLLALPAALLGLFGLASSGSQAIDGRLLLAYELCLIALAVLGTVALARLPSGTRPVRALAASAIALAGYAGLVVWLTNTQKVNFAYDRQASVREYNDAAARKTVARIADCARRHARSHPTEGYPAALGALEACVGKRFSSRGGARAGAIADDYLFFYFSDLPDEKGASRRFAVCARPVEPGVHGTLVIGVNPAGATGERRTAHGEPPNCFDVWARDDDKSYLEALSACVMSVASLAPQRGYPQWLFQGGEVPDTGLACGMPMREGAGRRVVTPRGIVEYLPELPDANGRADRYVIHLYPRSGAGGALAIDQTGTIRDGLFPGVASTLEAIEASRPAEQVKAERVAGRRASLTRDCEAGNLDACDALADFEWDNGEPRAAQRWWDHACERGRLMSCMFSSRYSPRLDTHEAQRNKERCKAGEQRYCERLQRDLEAQRVEIEAMRRSGGRQVSHGPAEMTQPSGKTQ